MSDSLYYLKILLCLSSILGTASCKFTPNNVRSVLQSNDIFRYIDKESIVFVRSEGGDSGTLSFDLKSNLECSIEYWAEDLNTTPNSSAPLQANCVGETMDKEITLNQLDKTVPYTFKIYVWPKALNASKGEYIVLKEKLDLKETLSQEFIFTQYDSPREAGETYSYVRPSKISLYSLREFLLNKYSLGDGQTCQETPIAPNDAFAFNKSTSTDVHLKDINTEGYALSKSTVHAGYSNIYTSRYENIDFQENWKWRFNWKDSDHEFTILPPTYIEEANLISEDSAIELYDRDLMGTLTEHNISKNTFEIEFKPIFVGHINYVHLEFKSLNPENKSLYCTVLWDGNNIKIADENFASLSNGEYQFLLMFETIQIHYKSSLPYPPWVITNRDWIHAKFNKVVL